MLDGLHEDLNRVKEKVTTEQVEANGRPDYLVAKESWERHLKRNDSIIQDLMGGQFKTRVDCPNCGNVSITFDPYLSISLPIPPPPPKQRFDNFQYFLITAN